MNALTNATRRLVDFVLTRQAVQKAIEPSFVSLPPLPDYHRKINIPISTRTRKVWLFGRNEPLGQVDYLTARRIVARHYWFDYNIRENKRPARLRSILDLIPILVGVAIVTSVVSQVFGNKGRKVKVGK